MNVGLDVFGELDYTGRLASMSGPTLCARQLGVSVVHTRVAGFTREGHEGVRVEFPRLVIGGFEDGGASHGGFGRSDEGEVLARDP